MAFQNERSPHREIDLNLFSRCVKDICHIFQVESLKSGQCDALFNFMQKKDVFVNMPTGSGKSLIFHIAPLAEMWMYSHAPNAKIWTKEPIIIIISPLIALMKDQVKRLNEVKYIQYVFNIFISNI